MAKTRQYWLVKTEPSTYSIEDLAAEPQRTTCWDGVRNYQARNYLRDEMRKDDRVLIYHSNAKPPAVVGVGKIVRAGYPDASAWNPDSPYYDEDTTPDTPRWFMVDIQLVEVFPRSLSLDWLKSQPNLEGMELLRKGSRLSVQPVRQEHFNWIVQHAHA
jgi:predicted RNA-binding protein with PUA-like domain